MKKHSYTVNYLHYNHGEHPDVWCVADHDYTTSPKKALMNYLKKGESPIAKIIKQDTTITYDKVENETIKECFYSVEFLSGRKLSCSVTRNI